MKRFFALVIACIVIIIALNIAEKVYGNQYSIFMSNYGYHATYIKPSKVYIVHKPLEFSKNDSYYLANSFEYTTLFITTYTQYYTNFSIGSFIYVHQTNGLLTMFDSNTVKQYISTNMVHQIPYIQEQTKQSTIPEEDYNSAVK